MKIRLDKILKILLVHVLMVNCVLVRMNHQVLAQTDDIFKFVININDENTDLINNQNYDVMFKVDENNQFVYTFTYDHEINTYEIEANEISGYLRMLHDQEIVNVSIIFATENANTIIYEKVMRFSEKDEALKLILEVDQNDMTLNYKDEIAPVYEEEAISLSSEKISNSIELTVNALDNYDRLMYEVIYSDEPKDIQSKNQFVKENDFTLNQNGYYYIFISDGYHTIPYLNNPVHITNIDTQAPKISNIHIENKEDGIYVSFKVEDEHQDGLQVKVNDILLGKSTSEYYVTVVDKDTKMVNIEVEDEAKNKAVQEVNVKYANVKHILNVTSNQQDVYSEEVMISLNAGVDSDDLDIKDYDYQYQYSIDGINYQDSNLFTIYKNGVITCYVKDQFNNMTTSLCTVTKVNRYEPSIENFKYMVKGKEVLETDHVYTNEKVKVTFDIQDLDVSQMNFKVEVIKDEKVIQTQQMTTNHFEYETLENGIYEFNVYDEGMKSCKKRIAIHSIDLDSPKFDYKVTTIPQEMINGFIKCASIQLINVEDLISGIDNTSCFAYQMQFNQSESLLEWKPIDEEIIVIENVTYLLYVKDLAGNITQKEVVISNIDDIKPMVHISENLIDSKNDYALKSDVIINIDDKESGLNTKETLSLDGGSTWISLAQCIKKNDSYQYRYEASKNETLNIIVKDAIGNESDPILYVIDHIDIDAPVINHITYDQQKWEKEKEIKIEAMDMGSGIKAYAYGLKGEEPILFKDNKCKVSENGIYVFYVEDYLGNQSVKEICINKIDQDAPMITYELKHKEAIHKAYYISHSKLEFECSFKDVQDEVVFYLKVESDNTISQYRKLKKVNKTTNESFKLMLVHKEGKEVLCVYDKDGNYLMTLEDIKKGESFEISLKAVDSCGNESVKIIKDKENLRENIKFMIEDVKPTIKLLEINKRNVYKDDKNTYWLSLSDLKKGNYELSFDIELSDKKSGLCSFMIEDVNQPKKEGDIHEYHPLTNHQKILWIMNQANVKKDGCYDLKYDLFVNGGRKSSFSLNNIAINKPLKLALKTMDYAKNWQETKQNITIQIDQDAPRLNLEKSFVETGKKRYTASKELLEDLSNTIVKKEYGYFFKDEVTFQLCFDEVGSGMKELRYYWSNHKDQEQVALYDKGVYSIKVNANQKGILIFYGLDNVGNKSEEYNIGMIVANQSKHNQSKSIDIELDSKSMILKNDTYYSKDNVNVIFRYKDDYSGIKEFRWTTKNDLNIHAIKAKFNVDFNKDGFIKGSKYQETFEIFEKQIDLNIVLDLKTKTMLTLEDTYMIDASFVDNAGFKYEYEGIKKVIVDKTKPNINIRYEGMSDSGSYYKENRKAIITIKDLHIDDECMKEIQYQKNGKVTTLTTSAFQKNQDGSYSCVIPFESDGVYQITKVEAIDLAGNKVRTEKEESFIIDKTTPKMNVSISGTPQNEIFYSQERVVTIGVEEKNFDASKFKSIIMYTNDDGVTISEAKALTWSQQGNIYTTNFILNKNGKYIVRITGKDKAGNQVQTYESNEFYIDLFDPVLKVNVEDKKAYVGDFSFVITMNDSNIDYQKSTYTLTHSDGVNVDIMPQIIEQGNEKVITFTNFLEKKKYDDIYTLTLVAVDKSNRKSIKTIMFSLNRFGSNYKLQTDLRKPFNKAVDVIVEEVNVSELSDVKIVLNYNQHFVILEEGKDYTIQKLKDRWYKNIYTIHHSVFEKDGNFQITIQSKDATNRINSTKSASKEIDLSLTVDKNAPKITAINVENNTVYEEAGKEVMFNIIDNIALMDDACFKIKVNHQLLSEADYCFDENAGLLKIKMKDSNKRQSIEIKVYDRANNESVLLIENILVTSDKMTIMLAKYGWFIAIITISVLFVFIVLLIVKKKNKREVDF